MRILYLINCFVWLKLYPLDSFRVKFAVIFDMTAIETNVFRFSKFTFVSQVYKD